MDQAIAVPVGDWINEMLGDYSFEKKGPYHSGNRSVILSEEVTVLGHAPNGAELVLTFPAGVELLVFRRYAKFPTDVTSATVFMDEEQVSIKMGGRIVRRQVDRR